MPDSRFVILRHEPGKAGPRELHWDLMLEFGDSLRTWAFAKHPALGLKLAVDELPRHRLHYLEYEGPVSQDRGEVARIDRGTFTVSKDSQSELFVELRGETLSGRLELVWESDQRWIASIGPS